LAIAPAVLSAQSSPITRPKQSAQRAVAATNAHTAAMTDTTAGGRTSTVSATGKAETPPARRGADSVTPNVDTTRTRVTTSKGTAPKAERTAFEREVFSYERAGRRDPFMSLMTSSEIRPLLPDLRLVGIAYDATGRNSVAVLREDAQDANAGNSRGGGRDMKDVPMYRVKEGQQLGRMRVARIGPKSVTFTIEEFGYSRQETLTVSESNTERKP
jgi:hypothetical protein